VTAVNKIRALDTRRKPAAPLDTPTDLAADAVSEISAALNEILATTFALYLKTKNFHWHVSGPHFRDYHLLLDDQADQIFASTDDVAERVRKIGGTTLRSIGQIAKLQGIKDNDESYVAPGDMLRELMADNKTVVHDMRECHKLCDDHEDVATASLLENFIDQAERRLWFLFEASRKADDSGH
jgi:starvation-inducible DNA-binding protein